MYSLGNDNQYLENLINSKATDPKEEDFSVKIYVFFSLNCFRSFDQKHT
jgi:hypothetical protein